MPVSNLSTVVSQPTSTDAKDDGFQLDVRIVEAGPVATALLSSTDDGCDTARGSDC
jgi:FxLD family lantipeptide